MKLLTYYPAAMREAWRQRFSNSYIYAMMEPPYLSVHALAKRLQNRERILAARQRFEAKILKHRRERRATAADTARRERFDNMLCRCRSAGEFNLAVAAFARLAACPPQVRHILKRGDKGLLAP